MSINFSFRSRVLKGLLAILPLFLTVAVVSFIFEFISQLTRPLVTFAIERIAGEALQAQLENHYQYVAFPLSVVFSVLLLYVLGVLAQFGLKALTDRTLEKVPVIASVYASIRQMVDLLSSSDGARSGLFKRVVLIELNPGVQLLGFMTGVIQEEETQKLRVSVYVPMPPNPTAGLIHWVDPDRLMKVEWPAEVAMKTLVSGGLLTPYCSQTRRVTVDDLEEFTGVKKL